MEKTKINRYKVIGYWHSEDEPYLPDPAWFVDENWDNTEKQLVIDYLNKGKPVLQSRGFSWCRFRCGSTICGSSDMTDGTYIYPEGLTHYIEEHNVKLPSEFINHIKGKPENVINKFLNFSKTSKNVVDCYECEMDYDWWLSQKGFKRNNESYKSYK